MTDKQIIIDGCDVSGCSYYDDRYGYCEACKDDIDGYSFTKCSAEDNCYYKQLKCKEQECEMWKNLTIDNGAVALKYQQQIDRLKAENDELKRLIAKQKNAKIQLSKLKDKQYKEFCDMKQTLTEIKEIAENREIFCENCSGGVEEFTCDDCGYVQILQKISEVEDGV